MKMYEKQERKLIQNLNWATEKCEQLMGISFEGMDEEERKELKEARTHYFSIKKEFEEAIARLKGDQTP